MKVTTLGKNAYDLSVRDIMRVKVAEETSHLLVAHAWINANAWYMAVELETGNIIFREETLSSLLERTTKNFGEVMVIPPHLQELQLQVQVD